MQVLKQTIAIVDELLQVKWPKGCRAVKVGRNAATPYLNLEIWFTAPDDFQAALEREQVVHTFTAVGTGQPLPEAPFGRWQYVGTDTHPSERFTWHVFELI
jgi:hypothetical protein